MSGGVDIRPFPDNWEMSNVLGKQSEYPDNWEKHTVMNQLHLLTPNSIKIIIDCGTEDFFYGVNVKLHNELLYRNIPHDFISRPGAHNRPYWNNAIKYQALFFADFFSSVQQNKYSSH
jgi:S-formylglutathione hydrolase FrmB